MVLLKNYSIKHTSFENLSNVHRKALEPLIYILKENHPHDDFIDIDGFHWY